MHADKECWYCSHSKSLNQLGVAVWMSTSLLQNILIKDVAWLSLPYESMRYWICDCKCDCDFIHVQPRPLNTSLLIADHNTSVARQIYMSFHACMFAFFFILHQQLHVSNRIFRWMWNQTLSKSGILCPIDDAFTDCLHYSRALGHGEQSFHDWHITSLESWARSATAYDSKQARVLLIWTYQRISSSWSFWFCWSHLHEKYFDMFSISATCLLPCSKTAAFIISSLETQQLSSFIRDLTMIWCCNF